MEDDNWVQLSAKTPVMESEPDWTRAWRHRTLPSGKLSPEKHGSRENPEA